jgi:hypothetical protein
MYILFDTFCPMQVAAELAAELRVSSRRKDKD